MEIFKEMVSGEILSSDEIHLLRRLLAKLDSANVATSNHVQSGTAFADNFNSWIVDSSANRHMTGSSKGIQNYSPCPKEDNVKIANGSLTPISGIETVICTPNIKLSSVLYVPEFPINLLSVSAITKALNCKIEFFPDHCIFQDLQTGKRIGSGRLRDDLYILMGFKTLVKPFLGKKCYKCYHPPSKRSFVSMDVTFREFEPYFSITSSPLQGESSKEEEVILPSSIIGPLDDIVTGKSEIGERIQGETIGRLDRPDLKTYSRKNRAEEAIMQSTNIEPSSTGELSTFPNELDEPIALRKGREAFVDPKWKQAMIEEMKALSKNETWELVTSPPDKKLVGSKWVFTVKHKADGSIERFKIRLVATQTYGVDYQETFAPVAKMNTVRIFLSCAANLDWDIKRSTPRKGLLFSKHDHLQIEAFIDAGWAGSLDDRRSTSGYCTLVRGNLVTWKSKKQSVVARSSAEAEYRAMALLWLQKLLQNLKLYEKRKTFLVL
ncbi:uncharacterized protein [Nicotiana sylvestris]|uniref:uncharacterized protein n=1 Tax=Nicotiana sylvestris TaxID=4096 RepID=UPI00388C9521